ncbi:SUKH-3 domain-containing protein [Streptomyces sp. NBC_00873]|uniref:SUKH-3 domain-containing protein n=1 Tax=Streptomyces sp. NBC_00873 TaxID=2975852 RepID=UPI003867BAD8|nr:SUKH-3 domain-containing protein [Streptomyces sp. NBC_00873]
MSELSEEAERVLLLAGWTPGRRVDTSAWRARLEGSGFSMHEAAERFLSEFGGLSFEYGGYGISRTREPFELDPLLGLGEDDRFREWGELIGVTLFPIGELDQGRYFLGLDDMGEIYLVADWLARFGIGLSGMESLILGVMPEVLYDCYPQP